MSEPVTDFNFYTSTPMTDAEIMARLRKTRCNPFPNPACQLGVLCQCAIEDGAIALIERLQSELTAERERAERNEKELTAVRFYYFLAARHAKTSAEKEHWIYEAERRAAIDAAMGEP